MKFIEGESYGWLFWRAFVPAVVLIGMAGGVLLKTPLLGIAVFTSASTFLLVTTVTSGVALNRHWVAAYPRGSFGYLWTVCLLLGIVSFSAYMLLGELHVIGHAQDGRRRRDAAIDSQIAKLKTANPAVDVADALAAGDRRFVGVMGFGLVVPGVDQSSYKYPEGVKVIPNTSDGIRNDSEAELQDVARMYALQYNATLLSRLRNSP
jgi:hypothetical protein